MRFHSLTMQAFGPYADQQTVNFDDIAGARDGIFLIEGPTGSGKSSILDAITFALYGSTDEDRGALRSTAAATGDESFVELVFSVGGQRYKVRRTPEYERPKKRGEGTTKALKTVQLSRWSADAWIPVSSSLDEVPREVTTIVGLTREQFSSVAVLPQGRFARFLNAKEEDRKKVLESLFDVQLYADVEKRLVDARTEATRSESEATTRLEKRLGEALVAARAVGWTPSAKAGPGVGGADAADDSTDGGVGIDAESAVTGAGRDSAPRASGSVAAQFSVDEYVAALIASGPAAVVHEVDQIDAWLAEHLQTLQTDRSELTKSLSAAQKAHKDAEAEADRAQKAALAHAALAEHLASKPDHDARQRRLRMAEQAESVLPLLASMQTAEAEAEQAQQALTAGPAVSNAEDDASASSLREAEVALREEIVRLEPLQNEDAAFSRVEAKLLSLREEHGEAKKQLERIDAELALMPDALQRAQQAVKQGPTLTALLEDLDARFAAAVELEPAEKERAERAAELESAKEAQTAAGNALFAATEQFEREAPGRLAAGLVPGEPCSVCGSTEHPSPAVALAHESATPGLADVRQAFESAQRHAEAMQGAWDEADAKVRDLMARSGGRPASELQAEQTDARAELEALQGLHPGVTAQEYLATQQAKDGQLRAARDEQGRLVATLGEQIRNAESRADEQAATVAAARGDFESIAARITALESAAEAAGRRAELADTLVQKSQTLESARAAVAAQAKKLGFDSWEAVKDAALDDDERRDLDGQIRRWSEQREVLASKLEGAEPIDPQVARQQADEARARAEERKQELDAVQAEVDAANGRFAATENGRTEFGDRKEKVVKAAAGLEQVQAEVAVVKRLGNLANGNGSVRRMTLTAFVLRQWFADVVAAANLRLDGISQGRYQLEITTQKDATQSAWDKTGLNLALRDLWTNAARSTSSLSGGERFYTSLSLALGLADVVASQSGARMLEMLFIDEGFDSLDGQTLDTVMDVIEGLRENGRTVGIISHVESLKERIPSRVMVRPRHDGTSTVTISDHSA